jgi:hypothetical protein
MYLKKKDELKESRKSRLTGRKASARLAPGIPKRTFYAGGLCGLGFQHMYGQGWPKQPEGLPLISKRLRDQILGRPGS